MLKVEAEIAVAIEIEADMGAYTTQGYSEEVMVLPSGSEVREGIWRAK